MKISVITVCYNSEETIEETIKSVISQTYPDIEYIIIDGASTDGTLNIIDKYKDIIDYFVSEPDSGMYQAMNKGIKVATGEWVFILNSDDSFIDMTVLKNAVREIQNFNGDILLGNVFLDHQVDPLMHNRIKSYKYVHTMMVYQLGLYQQAMFYNKNLFEKCGYFDENYQLISDIDWFYKFYKSLCIKHVDQVFCKFLIGGRSNNEEFAQICAEERQIILDKYLIKWHLSIYEFFINRFYAFAHKYFRTLARSKKVQKFVKNKLWNAFVFLMGWKIRKANG